MAHRHVDNLLTRERVLVFGAGEGAGDDEDEWPMTLIGSTSKTCGMLRYTAPPPATTAATAVTAMTWRLR